MVVTYVLIKAIDFIPGITFRMTEHEELLGADYTEHNILHPGVGVSRALSALGERNTLIPVGKNKGHMDYLERKFGELSRRINRKRKVSPTRSEVTTEDLS